MRKVRDIFKKVAPYVMFLFVIVLLPLQNYAQQADLGNLMGFVYKEDGKKPIKNAQIIIVHLESKKEFKSNITDKNGDYKIMNLPAGEYQVNILYKDKPYKLKRIDFYVRIFSGKTTFISFSLKKAYPLAIIIIGTAAAAGASQIIKSPEEKEVSPTIR